MARHGGGPRPARADGPGRPFARRYTPADVRLLADVDEAYGQMSGLATREVLRRQFEVFGDARFERLAALSNGHLYNLRGSATYRAKRTVWTRTRPTAVEIALRQAPEPNGKPGHVRVDTLHAWTPSTSGDRDGVKGLFLINLVDPDRSRSAVTQYELVGATAAISERFLLPLLEGLLLSFPFRILGFHADNASRRDAPAPSTSTTASRNCSTSCASRTAASGRVHQVPPAHLQRQRPGRCPP